MKKYLVWIGASILVLMAIFLYASFRGNSIEVKTATVTRRDVKEIVSASGKVEAERTIPVLSPSPDKVKEIYVKVGENVSEGDVLLKLDGAGKVKSPIDGKVVKISAEVEKPVAQGETLLIIADMKPTFLSANVDEADISKIKVGEKAEIVLDAYPKEKLEGEVSEIEYVAIPTQAGGTAFPVKISLKEKEGVDFRLGMSGDADIILAIYPDVLTVPIEAVTSFQDKDVVYVVKNSVAERKEVKLGLLSGNYYEVKEGLKEKDEVVVGGLNKIKDFSKIRVKVKR